MIFGPQFSALLKYVLVEAIATDASTPAFPGYELLLDRHLLPREHKP